jgi:hypothetical protein
MFVHLSTWHIRLVTVVVLQVNSSQCEARMLLRRTADRVPNLNHYLLQYWRGNHDVTVLIDAAHKMRYVPTNRFCSCIFGSAL